MSFKTISALLRHAWLIDPSYAESQLPLVAAFLRGDNVPINAFEDDEKKREDEHSFFMMEPQGANTFKKSYYNSFDQAKAGSVAIIPISGPIMKNDNCGDPGSTTRAKHIMLADEHDNISSIVLMVDSPGGMVDGTQSLADAIKNCSKPIIAFVDDGMAASAAYWISSACHEIYSSHATNDIGSIGVYVSIADYEKAFKKFGISIHQIYADQSTEKNLSYKEAIKGNYEPIKKGMLNPIADAFINAVKENRGSKLDTKSIDPFKGGLYTSDIAEGIGLIDGIMSFGETVERAYQLAKESTNSNTNYMFGKKKGATEAPSAIVTTEAPVVVTTEIPEPTTASVATLEEALTQNTELTTQLETATTRIAELEGKLDKKKARVSELKAKIAELETKPAVANTKPLQTGSDKLPGDQAKTAAELEEESINSYAETVLNRD